MALSNPGGSAAQADTYAANVYTVVNGGFGAGLQGQAESGVTAWLSYPARVVSLGPGRSEQQSFTVSVPDGTAPGEHITSLVVQERGGTVHSVAIALRQVSRQALPIVIDVPGHLSAGVAIGTASPGNFDGRTTIAVGMTNTGNWRLHPEARLVVTNSKGSRVGTFAVKMGTVYPGDTTSVEGTLSTVLAPGHYTVAADLTDRAAGVTAQREDLAIDVVAPPHFIAAPDPTPIRAPLHQAVRGIPTTLIAGLVLAALLAGAGASAAGARLRRRRATPTGAQAPPRRGTR